MSIEGAGGPIVKSNGPGSRGPAQGYQKSENSTGTLNAIKRGLLLFPAFSIYGHRGPGPGLRRGAFLIKKREYRERTSSDKLKGFSQVSCMGLMNVVSELIWQGKREKATPRR